LVAGQRRLRPCRYCGFQYKGRGLYADHGFAEFNLRRHEDACQGQRARSAKRRRRQMMKRLKAAGALEGQLGFPFDDVPEEIE
jgi:hypothetical protein